MARPGADADPTNRLLPAARALALDSFAAGVGEAFDTSGVRFVVIKGPTIARWLYGSEELRGYLDMDVLVRPQDADRARQVLTTRGLELSFLEAALPHGRRPHAEAWVDARTGLSVDLHETLPGVEVDAEAVWTILTEHRDILEIGGRALGQLAIPARTLLISLHAAHHGIADEQAIADLSRAVDRIPQGTWREAAFLADSLRAMPAFAAGLRLLQSGQELADSLELPTTRSIETILKASSAPELALSLDWLVQTRGWGARSVLISRKLVPPRAVLRARSPLARRGHGGLVLAYTLQPLQLASRAGPAIRAWLAARREARNLAQPSRRPPRP